jgi:hypothetical protein
MPFIHSIIGGIDNTPRIVNAHAVVFAMQNPPFYLFLRKGRFL